VSVVEVAELATDEAGDACFRILEASAAELEWFGADAGWTANLREPHPSASPVVQGLLEEWQTAWRRLAQADAAKEAEEVEAEALATWLASDDRWDDSLRVHVVSRTPGDERWERRFGPAVAAVLHHVVEEREDDTVAVLQAGAGYVQIMFRGDRTTVYAEAVDPAFQGEGTLTPGQRAELEALGWIDLKTAAMPYPDAQYANEWTGGNFAQELPLKLGIDEMARVLAAALAWVYGAEGDASLEVRVFDAVV